MRFHMKSAINLWSSRSVKNLANELVCSLLKHENPCCIDWMLWYPEAPHVAEGLTWILVKNDGIVEDSIDIKRPNQKNKSSYAI